MNSFVERLLQHKIQRHNAIAVDIIGNRQCKYGDSCFTRSNRARHSEIQFDILVSYITEVKHTRTVRTMHDGKQPEKRTNTGTEARTDPPRRNPKAVRGAMSRYARKSPADSNVTERRPGSCKEGQEKLTCVA